MKSNKIGHYKDTPRFSLWKWDNGNKAIFECNVLIFEGNKKLLRALIFVWELGDQN